MDDTDTDGSSDAELTPREALRTLDEKFGQSYTLADPAFRYLKPFAGSVTDAFIFKNSETLDDTTELVASDRDDEAECALSVALNDAQEPAADARGITSAYPHQQLVTANDISAILVEALGREPDDSTMLGHGSTSDVRHEANIETLADELGFDTTEE